MKQNVRDHGAVGDGTTVDTDAIQKGIDACAESGGGVVAVEAGRYVVGTIRLRSHVCLHLHAGAVLLSILNLDDFPNTASEYTSYWGAYETYKAILYAEGEQNVSVVGEGAIDGRCEELDIEIGYPSFSLRPRLIHFRGCSRVTIRGIELRNSATWTQHYRFCSNVTISGVTVQSRDNPDIEEARFARRFGLNQDGLDIDSCSNVHVSDCHINSGDDAVCLKSRSGVVCENVTVTNCTLSANASGIKLGTESNGGFRNVIVSNCAIYDTRMGGISISEVDGGVCENIVVSGIVMDNIKGAAVFVCLNNRARPLERDGEKPPVGSLRNVHLSGIIATRIGGVTSDDVDDFRRIGCSITGIPGQPVRGITVRDCRFRFIGGGSPDTCLDPVPETLDVYPNSRMFGGDLPAYGFYCRHVEDLRLCDLDLQVDEVDTRPAIVVDDVHRARIEGLRTSLGEGEEPVRLINTTDVLVGD